MFIVPSMPILFGPFLGPLHSFTILLIFFFFSKQIISSTVVLPFLYYVTMAVGFVFHFNMKLEEPAYIAAVNWSFLVSLLCLSKYYKRNGMTFLFILFFFIFECGIGIYEKINLTYFVDYGMTDYGLDSNIINNDETEFRSYSLVFHPLNNANAVSIILAFILVSKVNKIVKTFLLFLGFSAFWAFNSRGVIFCWLLILLIRFFLKKVNLGMAIKWLIAFLILTLLFIPRLDSSFLMGRLGEGLLDDSSMERILSFVYFFSVGWSIEDLIFGGRILLIPGTVKSLENGILLNLSYWGVIVGSAKTILELIITYSILKDYSKVDKLILMLGFWGVALMNNNSFQPIMFTIFMVSYVGFKGFEYKSNKKILNNYIN